MARDLVDSDYYIHICSVSLAHSAGASVSYSSNIGRNIARSRVYHHTQYTTDYLQTQSQDSANRHTNHSQVLFL